MKHISLLIILAATLSVAHAKKMEEMTLEEQRKAIATQYKPNIKPIGKAKIMDWSDAVPKMERTQPTTKQETSPPATKKN